MSILLWIVFGGVVGWIGSIIMGTNAQQGLIANIVIGIVGSLMGGFAMNYLGFGSMTEFSLFGFLAALAGAIVLIFIVKLFR
jgi:uncharacterized membrane protein YeaQ/YmgE (transglycosylase-associated protein family)